MERRRPFTLDHMQFSITKENLTTELTHERNESEKKHKTSSTPASSTYTIRDVSGYSHSITSRGVDEDVLLGLLASKGYRISSPKQLARLHDPGEYVTEIEVICQVLAYFESSSKRIIDIMPMIFETVFASEVVEELREALTSSLKLVGDPGPANCVKYTQDEPAVETEREELLSQKNTLL